MMSGTFEADWTGRCIRSEVAGKRICKHSLIGQSNHTRTSLSLVRAWLQRYSFKEESTLLDVYDIVSRYCVAFGHGPSQLRFL